MSAQLSIEMCEPGLPTFLSLPPRRYSPRVLIPARRPHHRPRIARRVPNSDKGYLHPLFERRRETFSNHLRSRGSNERTVRWSVQPYSHRRFAGRWVPLPCEFRRGYLREDHSLSVCRTFQIVIVSFLFLSRADLSLGIVFILLP